MITLDDKLYALMETDADAAHRCTFIEWRRMMLALCREEDGLSDRNRLRVLRSADDAGVDRQSVVTGQSDLREARARWARPSAKRC